MTPKASRTTLDKIPPIINVIATQKRTTKKKALDLEEEKASATPATTKPKRMKTREKQDGPFSEQNTLYIKRDKPKKKKVHKDQGFANFLKIQPMNVSHASNFSAHQVLIGQQIPSKPFVRPYSDNKNI